MPIWAQFNLNGRPSGHKQRQGYLNLFSCTSLQLCVLLSGKVFLVLLSRVHRVSNAYLLFTYSVASLLPTLAWLVTAGLTGYRAGIIITYLIASLRA